MSTETVPPVTITPDHVLLVPLPLTVFVPSLNFQLENVLPDGPVAVQVTLPPRVTCEGEQARFATTPPELSLKPVVGHEPPPQSWPTWTGSFCARAEIVGDPALPPLTSPVATVATLVLLLLQLLWPLKLI